MNDRLETIIQSAPLAIFDIDREGRVSSIWNPAAERIFGWKRDEVVGQPVPIVPPEKQSEFATLRSIVMNGESIIGKELVRRRKNERILRGHHSLRRRTPQP